MMTFSIFLVCFYICIFVVGISILTKILPSYRRPEIKWLIVFITSICVISFCSLNVYILDSFDAKILFSRWRFIGFAVIAQAWFFFLLQTFTNNKILRNPFFVVPVVCMMLSTVVIAIIPELGHFLTNNYEPFHFNGANVVKFSNGPWFPVHILQVYIFAFFATAYVAAAIPCSSGTKRNQLIALSIGGIIGIAADAYGIYSDSPLRWAMLSGGSFLITECSILYAINKHGLLDLSSVAKNKIFNSISDPVLIIDQNETLIDFNQAARDSFKIEKLFLNKPLRNLDLFKNFDFMKNNQEWTKLDDKICHYQVTSETLNLFSGKILIFRDTTAQKKIEENLNIHLDFKAKLLSMIAHDFSGILSAQSFLSSELEKEVAPDLREHAGNLTNSAYANQDFMNNVLVWAHAQEKQFKPIIREYEINTLISDVVNNLESIWKLQGIEIIISSQVRPLILKGDIVMIDSVIRNLLTNAIRASSAGGKINISLAQNGNCATIAIEDKGIGMSPTKLKLIQNNSLDAFNDKEERSHGFGLGLIIARRFVELHEGQLNFSSIEGKGTSVTLSLPL